MACVSCPYHSHQDYIAVSKLACRFGLYVDQSLLVYKNPDLQVLHKHNILGLVIATCGYCCMCLLRMHVFIVIATVIDAYFYCCMRAIRYCHVIVACSYYCMYLVLHILIATCVFCCMWLFPHVVISGCVNFVCCY